MKTFMPFCFLAVLVLGCAVTQQVIETTSYEQLDFLKDGQTTKEEVLLTLGIPGAQFEGERILAYRMRTRKDGTIGVVPPEMGFRDVRLAPERSAWPDTGYSLILAFDEKNVLQKHSLVKVSH